MMRAVVDVGRLQPGKRPSTLLIIDNKSKNAGKYEILG
jgi:hypothetical protein